VMRAIVPLRAWVTDGMVNSWSSSATAPMSELYLL
jgi:hypothetical protein